MGTPLATDRTRIFSVYSQPIMIPLANNVTRIPSVICSVDWRDCNQANFSMQELYRTPNKSRKIKATASSLPKIVRLVCIFVCSRPVSILSQVSWTRVLGGLFCYRQIYADNTALEQIREHGCQAILCPVRTPISIGCDAFK